ncbi:MAG: methyltransferase domain-containing protein [Vicinamibacterales bacterium]|nr:methyltransferase domain-containing protein [Vicinamibacterales bacterium]
MEPALQRRVQRYGWDKAVDDYERFWSAQLQPAQDRLLEMAALESGEHVLDLACGTGLVSLPAARAVGPSGRLVGTDISARMVERAREEAHREGLSHAVFERMGAEALDLPDGAFDVVLCALGLMYLPDASAALHEMRRVLAPGGRAVVAVWGARGKCGWADIFPIVDARVRSEVCPLFFMLGTGERLAHELASADFTDVTAERLSAVLEYATADDALGAAFAGGPVAMAYSRFDEATRAAAHAEYLASIAAYRQGEGYRIPGEFVVARGTRPAPEAA